MEKLKKLTSMGYLTYGSAVTPKDILLSPYRLWSDTGMLDIAIKDIDLYKKLRKAYLTIYS